MKLILVNTRFNKYNHKFGFNDKHEEKNLYQHFIQMIKALNKKYPHLNILVRPHPMENPDSYRMELNKCKNVHVVSEGTVTKWMLASKLVIHNGCTTGIEAYLLDKPVISYIPVRSEKFNEYLPNEISRKIINIKELFDFINSLLVGKLKSEEQREIDEKKNIMSLYYGAMDGNYAYENIIRLFNNMSISCTRSLQEPLLQTLPILTIERNPKDQTVEKTKDNGNSGIMQDGNSGISEEIIRLFFYNIDKVEKHRNIIQIRTVAPQLFEIRRLND